MKPSAALFLILLLSLASHGYADQEADPFPWIITSDNRECLFKMVPGKGHVEGQKYVWDRLPVGTAYRMDEDGNLSEWWKAEGWYTFKAYISDEGRFLVRMGPWARYEEELSDLAVAFYDKGKLLKEYRVKDLLRNPKMIQLSMGHYQWQPARQTDPDRIRGRKFYLTTIDKATYTFSLESGEIVATGTDPGAKTYAEVWDEEINPEKRGYALFQDWPFRESFERQFTFSRTGVDTRRLPDDGGTVTHWIATMTPRKKYAHPCLVDAAFLVSATNSLRAFTTPGDIDRAFTRVMEHSLISQTFKGADGEFRMEISGDRLHRDTDELREWLKLAGGPSLNDEEIPGWAKIVVQFRGAEVNGGILYFDTRTDRIVYKGNGPLWPATPTMFGGESRKKGKAP
jgi:hypothetical protein